jgi:hypothetical protein
VFFDKKKSVGQCCRAVAVAVAARRHVISVAGAASEIDFFYFVLYGVSQREEVGAVTKAASF